MEQALKIIVGLTVAAVMALVVLFLLDAFEMPWFDDVQARFG